MAAAKCLLSFHPLGWRERGEERRIWHLERTTERRLIDPRATKTMKGKRKKGRKGAEVGDLQGLVEGSDAGEEKTHCGPYCVHGIRNGLRKKEKL